MVKPIKEDELKDSILGNVGKWLIQHNYISHTSTFLFEKSINFGKTISDCLIVDDIVVGIELKSEYDTLKRLKNQLQSYETLCDYTFVLVNDKFYEEVFELLNTNPKLANVGVITYENFEGDVIFGELKPPKRNANININSLLYSLLDKRAAFDILNSYMAQGQSPEYRRGDHSVGISVNMSRKVLISMIIKNIPLSTTKHLINEYFKVMRSRKGSAHIHLNAYGIDDRYEHGSRAWSEEEKRKLLRNRGKLWK